jgi:hypothetical protein
MNDSRIDADTAERLLRGEPVGPPVLAALLTAASDEASAAADHREEAAVTAFRDARSRHAPRRAAPPSRRIRPRTARTALIAFLLLLLTGAAAATSDHLPGPFGSRHDHSRLRITPRTTRTSADPVTPPGGSEGLGGAGRTADPVTPPMTTTKSATTVI